MLVFMSNNHHAIGRILYEIATHAGLPLHVWAAGMMYFHAFEEYTIDYSPKERISRVMVGVTSLALAVKANESFIVSKGSTMNPVHRLLHLLDSAARVILSYTAQKASSEKIVEAKKRLKEFIPIVELAIMRVVGNSLVPETVFLENNIDQHTEAVLVEIYSSPVCLNFPPPDISSFARGTKDNSSIREAIEKFFI
jgi:hypothetical protein